MTACNDYQGCIIHTFYPSVWADQRGMLSVIEKIPGVIEKNTRCYKIAPSGFGVRQLAKSYLH